MPRASVKRLIECKKEDLINLVLDIEKYPEFIPYCYAAKVHETKEENNSLGPLDSSIWIGILYLSARIFIDSGNGTF